MGANSAAIRKPRLGATSAAGGDRAFLDVNRSARGHRWRETLEVSRAKDAMAISQQHGGTIDLDLAKKALGDLGPVRTRQTGITDIVDVVTSHFNVRLADLQSKRRHRSIAFPRQVCMYLARDLTTLSLEEIGGYFGGRDHTTVLHAARTIADQRKADTELHQTLHQLTDRLRQQAP